MNLPLLYHWSPADRFDAINRDGLIAGSPNTVASSALPVVCLAPDPRCGWAISGGMDWVSEVEEWDLWLVALADEDEVNIRPAFGPAIEEIKVRNNIPRDRIWHVARRSS